METSTRLAALVLLTYLVTRIGASTAQSATLILLKDRDVPFSEVKQKIASMGEKEALEAVASSGTLVLLPNYKGPYASERSAALAGEARPRKWAIGSGLDLVPAQSQAHKTLSDVAVASPEDVDVLVVTAYEPQKIESRKIKRKVTQPQPEEQPQQAGGITRGKSYTAKATGTHVVPTAVIADTRIHREAPRKTRRMKNVEITSVPATASAVPSTVYTIPLKSRKPNRSKQLAATLLPQQTNVNPVTSLPNAYLTPKDLAYHKILPQEPRPFALTQPINVVPLASHQPVLLATDNTALDRLANHDNVAEPKVFSTVQPSLSPNYGGLASPTDIAIAQALPTVASAFVPYATLTPLVPLVQRLPLLPLRNFSSEPSAYLSGQHGEQRSEKDEGRSYEWGTGGERRENNEGLRERQRDEENDENDDEEEEEEENENSSVAEAKEEDAIETVEHSKTVEAPEPSMLLQSGTEHKEHYGHYKIHEDHDEGDGHGHKHHHHNHHHHDDHGHDHKHGHDHGHHGHDHGHGHHKHGHDHGHDHKHHHHKDGHDHKHHHKHGDDGGHKDDDGEYKYEKGEGEEHKEGHHGDHGEKGEKEYQNWHEYDKGEKGHHDKEDHKHHYGEHGGEKKGHHEEGGYHGEHHHGEGGKKEAEFDEKGEHQKGHSTKGEHSVHKKDEYEKKTEFFDEFHEGGDLEKDGEFHHEHEEAEGGHEKAGHYDFEEHDEKHGKEHKHAKGHHHEDHKGHKAEDGHDEHHHDEEKHGKKEDHGEGKKWSKKSGSGGGHGKEGHKGH